MKAPSQDQKRMMFKANMSNFHMEMKVPFHSPLPFDSPHNNLKKNLISRINPLPQ